MGYISVLKVPQGGQQNSDSFLPGHPNMETEQTHFLNTEFDT